MNLSATFPAPHCRHVPIVRTLECTFPDSIRCTLHSNHRLTATDRISERIFDLAKAQRVATIGPITILKSF